MGEDQRHSTHARKQVATPQLQTASCKTPTLLLRFFEFASEGESVRMLIFRDLRATERLQRQLQDKIVRYQRALNILEQNQE